MKKIFLSVLIGISAITIFVGCLKNKKNDYFDEPCSYDSCQLKAPTEEIQAVQKYLTDSNLTATQHCSGLFYRVETEGSGVTPGVCSYITVKFKGKLSNGTVFDEGLVAEYLGRFIPGWANGLPYIKKGGKIHLYIPPTLGYGPTSNGSIPGNSLLIFEVELLSVVQ